MFSLFSGHVIDWSIVEIICWCNYSVVLYHEQRYSPDMIRQKTFNVRRKADDKPAYSIARKPKKKKNKKKKN